MNCAKCWYSSWYSSYLITYLSKDFMLILQVTFLFLLLNMVLICISVCKCQLNYFYIFLFGTFIRNAALIRMQQNATVFTLLSVWSHFLNRMGFFTLLCLFIQASAVTLVWTAMATGMRITLYWTWIPSLEIFRSAFFKIKWWLMNEIYDQVTVRNDSSYFEMIELLSKLNLP